MKCDQCGMAVPSDELYELAGKTLCEDCYLDIKAVPKTCDPWAVHSARNTPGQQPVLTPVQEQILSFIRTTGPLTAEQICDELTLTELDFQRHFASLRHMELARAFKKGDLVCYTVFNQ